MQKAQIHDNTRSLQKTARSWHEPCGRSGANGQTFKSDRGGSLRDFFLLKIFETYIGGFCMKRRDNLVPYQNSNVKFFIFLMGDYGFFS